MLKLKDCPTESLCPKGKLHDYIPFESAVVVPGTITHRCESCGSFGTWKSERGRILDQEGYVAAHFRDFLQPFYPTEDLYRQFHGQQGIEAFNESRKPKESTPTLEDIADEGKDMATKKSVKVK